ncbi:MAG: aryl-sulfate sulfotransferase [Bryobacteraceae bacterium]
MRRLAVAALSVILVLAVFPRANPLRADDIYLGLGSVSLFDLNSVLAGGTSELGSFGPSGAITGIPDGQGNVWVVTYAAGTSTIQKYDGNGNAISGEGFAVSAAIQNGVIGPSGNLFLSTSAGQVYEYSSGSLTEVTSWNIASGNPNLSGSIYSAIGIASDGSDIFTTEGDAGTFIDEWSSSGTLLSSLDVGVSGLYGLGLDGSFFAGTPGFILEFDTGGGLDNAFQIGGANFSLSTGAAPATLSSVPEPSALPILMIGAVLIGLARLARRGSRLNWVLQSRWAVVFLIPVAYGQISLKVSSSQGSAPIGSAILVSAAASDSNDTSATFTYQFNVMPPGLSNYSLIRDYSPVNSFPFATTAAEGVYTIQVVALESTGATASGMTPLTFTPVATTAPVVSATTHPLVAMYSLPPCPVGSQARVHFRLTSAFLWNYTSYQNCTGSTSLNFLIGGMHATSSYVLQHDILTGPSDTLGPLMSFTTGAIPQNALNAIPPYSVTVPAAGPNSTAYPVLLTVPVSGFSVNAVTPFAVDTTGQVIWYLPAAVAALQANSYMTHTVPGGTFLVIGNQESQGDKQLLQEYDLAGNLLRETNATAISKELTARGTDPITSISHEIFRFPNGDTGLVGTVEKVIASAYDSNTNTVHSNVDVLGDMGVVLDSNFHVKWSWDEFDYAGKFATKAVNGTPLPAYTGMLNETCTVNPGCPPLENINPSTGKPFTIANDWTHTNSLAPTPDSNLIISIRHQDMVIKINYNNGRGDGTILWRLGPEGNLAPSPGGQDPFVFFNTHQHDAEYDTATGLLTLFDNGNTRVESGLTSPPNSTPNSRGQAWQIDDATLTATRVVNVDLGAYSSATGSAQRLANGNYHFFLGDIYEPSGGANPSQSVEVTTAGTDEFAVSIPTSIGYRSFRMNSLYSKSGEVVYVPFFDVPLGN